MAKFDGDLTFEPDYFEKCFDEFDRDPKLGVGGGVICYVVDGKKQIRGGSGISRSRRHQDLPKGMLGWHRRISGRLLVGTRWTR